MSVDIRRLERDLLAMSAEGAPGKDFCAAIAELARRGCFSQLRDVLPAIVYNELWARYQEDGVGFVASWELLAKEMRQGFVEHARQRLSCLTQLQQAKDDSVPAWQEIQRALDAQRNDLLRTAFAVELLEMVEPAVDRATHLKVCVVSGRSSEQVDKYLDEATRCYFLGLFTACAVMCRSVLEEAVRQRLPLSLARQVQSRYRNAATLGNLLHEVNNNLLLTGIDPEFPQVANRVNDAGKRAVHRGMVLESEALSCLQNARLALELLLP